MGKDKEVNITRHLRPLRKLDTFRKAAGWTQSQLANFLQVGQTNIARLENNPNSISLLQLSDWIRYCGLASPPQANFYARLSEIPIPQPDILGFAREIEEMLHCLNIEIDLERKPLMTIYAEREEDIKFQTLFVRSLLMSSDKQFFGFYLPANGCTVLWKHIADRPKDRDDNVYVLDGILAAWMRNSPLGHLKIAHNSIGNDKSGSFEVILESEELESTNNQLITIFSDHPLLRYLDVIQIPPFSYEIQQSFQNFQMITNAEISILCAGYQLNLSASSLVTSISSGKSFDFLVSPEGWSLDGIQKSLNHLYEEDASMIFALGQFGSLKGNKNAFDELTRKIKEQVVYRRSKIQTLLDSGVSTTDIKNPYIKRRLPIITDKLGIREKGLLNFAKTEINISDSNFPLERVQLVRLFLFARAVMNPRFNSPARVNEEDYEKWLKKFLDNFDKDKLLLEEVDTQKSKLRQGVTKPILDLIVSIWEQTHKASKILEQSE